MAFLRCTTLWLTLSICGVLSQLSGSVGPTTSLSAKSKVCNVLSYGAKADGKTDIGPAILSAFNNCAKAGGATIYIPSGTYAMATWVTLNGGSKYAIQIDGIINRTGTAGGHMIIVENAKDVEIFSSTSKGAIQGLGYQFHNQGKGVYGPRIMRIVDCQDFSVHDLALVDSPAFHLIVDGGSNGELYNLMIRGGDEGGLDGIDISGSNHWVHDVSVTNRDECVTVKSPSSNFLIERIYCNQSGGSAIGSLSTGTAISNIYYRNIYSWNCNQMMMIKSNGGSGYVRDVTFENFVGYGNAYFLDIDQYWSGQSSGSTSTGVQLSGITFKNWKGTSANGQQRAPMQILCSNAAPCTGISVTDFAAWTDSGSEILYKCESAYGSGGCLKSGSGGSYSTISSTITNAPSGYNSGGKMSEDLASGFGLTSEIAIPALLSSYFPGLGLLKPLMSSGGTTVSSGDTGSVGSGSTTTAGSASSPSAATGSGSDTGSCSALYGQCGGSTWSGSTCCTQGSCQAVNEYYSQCLS